jgi:hypothetical protein
LIIREYHLVTGHLFRALVNSLPSQLRPVEGLPEPNSDGPSAVVKEAQIEALKSIAKNLLGIDLLDVKVVKERELGKDLTPAEDLQTYENEIKKLRINPQRLREDSEAGRYKNRLVSEKQRVDVLGSLDLDPGGLRWVFAFFASSHPSPEDSDGYLVPAFRPGSKRLPVSAMSPANLG